MENIKKYIGMIKNIAEMSETSENLDFIVNNLASIRNMTDAAIQLAMDVDKQCTHPVEHRLNLSTMGKPEEWQCKLCGYEYKEGGQTNGNEG